MVICAQPADLLELLPDEEFADEPLPHSSAEGSTGGVPARAEEECRRTVLVIEDDPDFRRMLVASLKLRFGYRVLDASEALAGLAMVAREQPDLVLMDLAMPNMDGLAATRLLKRNSSTACIRLWRFPTMGVSRPGSAWLWTPGAFAASIRRCAWKSCTRSSRRCWSGTERRGD
jgi:PleD family two-component response regulator